MLTFLKKQPTIIAVCVAMLVGCATQSPTNTTQNPSIAMKNGVPSHYQVQAGDTISKIAKRYDLNWREISAMNRLDTSHTIYIGQWLVLWQSGNIKKPEVAAMPKAEKTDAPKDSKPLPAPSPILQGGVTQIVGQVNTERVFVAIPAPKQPESKPEKAEAKPTPKIEALKLPEKPKSNEDEQAEELAQKASQKLSEKKLDERPKSHESGLPLLMPMGNTPLNVQAQATQKFRSPVGGQNKAVRQFGATVNGVKSEGVFFAGKDGDIVAASQSGTVIYADEITSDDKPRAVIIEHADGYVSTYIHLKDIAVKKGQMVSAGATVGSMQKQTANLALFEFRLAKDGQFIDPMTVLK